MSSADRVDAPYSILSDLVDLEVFVDRGPRRRNVLTSSSPV